MGNKMESDKKRQSIQIVIGALDGLRDDAHTVIVPMQDSDVYPPDIDTDEVFDQVIDILNCIDHELTKRSPVVS
jgi:hypothetical protein